MKAILDLEQVATKDSDPTLVWDAIVGTALRVHASDIHILAQKGGSELAYRLDGDMRRQGCMPPELSRKMINHVKSLASMDVAESRRPTEGRMLFGEDGSSVDLRISVIPTIHGQDMVVRLFNRNIALLDLHELGLLDEQLNYVNDMITRPHGLVLVCGPTGSGKTTTLYAMLRRMAGKDRKIMTIENPVEYDLAGVNQSQVNTKIGVNFAALLTAILRQDPDIIMVGEIRDEETAATAVRAANTGTLVLATTHATRSSRAIETMLGLGVHPYFLAVALRGVISQVLVKRICPACRQPLPETASMIVDDAIASRLAEQGLQPQLYQGLGCEKCFNIGYHGRTGIFDLFVPDEKVKQMILDRSSAVELDRALAAGKMLTLEQAGKLAALSGVTTMEEIVDALPMA